MAPLTSKPFGKAKTKPSAATTATEAKEEGAAYMDIPVIE